MALLLGILFLAPRGLKALGTWLVIDDPLQPARAVVVLGGQAPFRAIEAAHVFQNGWTREVWLTQGSQSPEDEALARLGTPRAPEYLGSEKVLARLGVPSGAVRVLAGTTPDTAEEVRVIGRELRKSGGGRVILVTSKYHTRRVRVLWQALIGARPEAIVRFTPDDPFVPDRWWGSTGDAWSVSREWLGLFNAWAGLPLKPRP